MKTKAAIDNSTANSNIEVTKLSRSAGRFENFAPQMPRRPIRTAAMPQPQTTHNDIVNYNYPTTSFLIN